MPEICRLTSKLLSSFVILCYIGHFDIPRPESNARIRRSPGEKGGKSREAMVEDKVAQLRIDRGSQRRLSITHRL